MATLYQKPVIKRQSFAGVKKVVVPKQSMSLREIVRRFVRRESLPVSHEGVYENRFGDLEKMRNLDIVDQLEIADDLKAKIKAFEKRTDEENAAKAKTEEENRINAEIVKRQQAEAKSMAKSASPARGLDEVQ